ncbi:MAG: hypothetical protein IKX25_05220, partial [Bacteroidales bacterium]|nr:hypothetical protein [Bacteroidales bacterium]
SAAISSYRCFDRYSMAQIYSFPAFVGAVTPDIPRERGELSPYLLTVFILLFVVDVAEHAVFA